MKKVSVLLLSAAAAIVLAGCNGNPAGSSSSDSGTTPSSSDPASSGEVSSDPASSGEVSSDPASSEVTPEPILTGFTGLVGYGTEGQPYSLTVAPNGSATFHGRTDSQDTLDLSQIQLSYSVSGIVTIATSQSKDAQEYSQVDFAVTAVAEGSTVLTITDASNTYSINITVGEDSKWEEVESAWKASTITTGFELAVPPEPTFDYTSAEFAPVTEGYVYGLHIYVMENHLDDYKGQLDDLTGYSDFAKDEDGFWSFKVTSGDDTLAGYAYYADGEIGVTYSYGADPIITIFEGLDGYGTEGQPYSLTVAPEGTASFHGSTDSQDTLNLGKISITNSDETVASVVVGQSKDSYGYSQVDFAVVAGATEGSTTLTITDAATTYTVTINVGEIDKWADVESAWNASAIHTELGLAVPPAPSFNYISADFSASQDGSSFGINIYVNDNHLAAYIEQLQALTSHNDFKEDSEGFYWFDVTAGSTTLLGMCGYTSGQIILSYSILPANAADITMLSGVQGWQNPYSFAATVGEVSSFCGYTEVTSELDITGVTVSASVSGIVTCEVSQSIVGGYAQVDFDITGVKAGETVLTITDARHETYTVNVTVSEASEGGWSDVLIAWNATNLAQYNGALAPVEPTFAYTAAAFKANESGYSTGSYELRITTAAENWETYINALIAADKGNGNYTWNFGAYDSASNSYPLTVIEMLTGSSTYDSEAGAIVISFAAAA